MADNKDSYTYKTYIKNKKIFRWIGIILGVFALFVAFMYLKMAQDVAYTSTGVIIASIIVYIIFNIIKRWDKQNWRDIKRNYQTWGKGAGAEWKVDKSLEELPTGYKWINDFSTGRGNIDNIIIGPTGIFTIEVKAHRGIISFRNGQLFINNRLPEKDYIKQTWAEKNWLSTNLQQQFNKLYNVTSVLEFVNGNIDKNTIKGEIEPGIWIGEHKFHNWLILHKPNATLIPEEIEIIYTFLLSEKSLNATKE